MAVVGSVTDAVVRAAAWDDGGAEFIFVDGTILSFVDDMNTFVAVRSSATRASPRGPSQSHHSSPHDRQRQRRPCTSPEVAAAEGAYVDSIRGLEDEDADDEDGDGRELCFTAWTLSRDVDKVRAALHIFNSLSEHPRLLSSLLPSHASPDVDLASVPAWPRHAGGASTAATSSSSTADPWRCGVWRNSGPPIDRLVLERRRDLFRRYAVVGAVREWVLTPDAAESLSPSPPAHNNQLDGHRVATPPHHVHVGTVLELWCALRRVRMTVAVHRDTFTVRWPAPVTRPDGSRLPPTSSPSWPACVAHSSRGATTPTTATTAAASAAAPPLLFTHVEQTFPVCDPPDAWRAMLRLALELDAELPSDEGETDPCLAAPSPAPQQSRLPEPRRWSGLMDRRGSGDGCRFSAISASQAAHLAAPRTTRAVAAMRELHRAGARLQWMYEADHSGPSRAHPPAVYWCLRPTPSAPLRGAHVLAWVAEDGSCVRAALEARGYTISHSRLSAEAQPAATVVYRLHAGDRATADLRLPPTTAPLRCRVRAPSTTTPRLDTPLRPRGDPNAAPPSMCSASEGGEGSGECGAAVAAAAARWAVAVIDTASLRCECDAPPAAPEVVMPAAAPAPHDRASHPAVTPACVCAVMAALTHRCALGGASPALALPNADTIARGTMPLLALSEQETTQRLLRCGRYLAAVADVAVHLSQVNCAVPHVADAAASISCPQRVAAYCGRTSPSPSPLLRRSCTAAHAEWRHAADDASVTAADAVVYLTSRLDGIGTFTALTNGTIRVRFDDRTLLTLTPGHDELDEAQLLATCVMRDATRCTMRPAQCPAGHAMHRYLVYALPFRHYVYWRAVDGGGGGGDGDAVPSHRRHPCLSEQDSVTERSVSLLDPTLGESIRCLSDAPSCSPAISITAPHDTRACVRHLASSSDVAAQETDVAPRDRRSSVWGLADTHHTMRAYHDDEAAEVAERRARLEALLERNAALSHTTRALLRQ
ncbi:hypothetical protein NESM_000284900 [Novymonas esmeraldas]|uniref:C5orf34-like C-terminal domain-containing protein n=1 Tax=Novymonas esmeraldas TaxID=1808958 RepID=A0AAW0FDX3_9TRYP